MLAQEQDDLRAAVERVASFSPDVVLVERGVARFAQELMLEKGIALVLNVKLPKLDRIARCTGVQVRRQPLQAPVVTGRRPCQLPVALPAECVPQKC